MRLKKKEKINKNKNKKKENNSIGMELPQNNFNNDGYLY